MILHSDGTPIIQSDADLRALAPVGVELGRGYDASNAPAEGYSTASIFWNIEKIPRSKWDELIDRQDREQSSVEHWCEATGVPITDQKSYGYCWMYGTIGACMAKAAMDGFAAYRNPFYPAYLGKNGANQGGWAEEALRYIQRFGCPEFSVFPDQPTNRSAFEREEVKRSAEQFKVFSFFELPRNDFDAACSALLRPNPLPITLGLNWWGHLIYATKVARISAGEYGLLIRNSWTERWGNKGKAILPQPKATAFEQFAIDLMSIAA